MSFAEAKFSKSFSERRSLSISIKFTPREAEYRILEVLAMYLSQAILTSLTSK